MKKKKQKSVSEMTDREFNKYIKETDKKFEKGITKLDKEIKKTKELFFSGKGKIKPTKKQLQEYNQPRQVKFFKVKKNNREKFEDIISKFKHPAHTKTGNFSKAKYNKLIKENLKINSKQLKKYLSGNYTKADIKKIDKLFKAGQYEPEKRETVKFTKHTFTWENFPKKKISNLKKNEQYYFRIGIKLVFKSKNTGVFDYFDGEMFEVWTIPNFPVALHEPNIKVGFPKAYKKFFEMVKTQIEKKPSLWFFSFNYFDVTILNMEK